MQPATQWLLSDLPNRNGEVLQRVPGLGDLRDNLVGQMNAERLVRDRELGAERQDSEAEEHDEGKLVHLGNSAVR